MPIAPIVHGRHINPLVLIDIVELARLVSILVRAPRPSHIYLRGREEAHRVKLMLIFHVCLIHSFGGNIRNDDLFQACVPGLNVRLLAELPMTTGHKNFVADRELQILISSREYIAALYLELSVLPLVFLLDKLVYLILALTHHVEGLIEVHSILALN